jgi:hypothetical protein
VSIPANVPQLLILLGFVIPGSVYQAVRSRLLGPMPDEQDVTNKILRAIGFSAALNAFYVVLFGPWLLDLARQAPANPRMVGFAALGLMIALPALLALVDYQRLRQGWTLRTSYDPTPSAWDFMFQDREPCFVRVRTPSGQWVGGWFGPESYASSFPQPRDLFIQSAYLMNPDGAFGSRQDGTLGIYVRCAEADVIEFLATAPEEVTDGQDE